VDGVEVPLLRANGKHRAVPLPAGARDVSLRYHPPGLRAGLALTFLSVLALLTLWMRAPPRESSR